MGKHRHQQRYRRPIVTAIALGVIGIPSVAMACADWPGSGQRQYQDTATPVTAEDRWDDAGRRPQGNSRQHSEPTAAPSATPTATASASKTGAPRHSSAKPWHKPKKTALQTPTSKPTATTPKPTATAPKPTTAGPEPTASASSPAATGAPEASGAVAKVVEIVNAERSKAGCSPVEVNTTLTEAAQKHSEDMAASGNMSHTGSDGSSPDDRITRAGYNWSTYGENVAYGYSTPSR